MGIPRIHGNAIYLAGFGGQGIALQQVIGRQQDHEYTDAQPDGADDHTAKQGRVRDAAPGQPEFVQAWYLPGVSA